MMQRNLEGDKADPNQTNFEEVEFYYYETNYSPVLHESKTAFKVDCIEKMQEYMDVSSRVDTQDLSEEELKTLATEFVETVFENVWDMIDSTGYSLWIKHGDVYEMPVYIKSPVGIYTSASTVGSYGENQKSVSEVFLKAVGQIPQEEYNGWSNCEEHLWDKLAEIEKELFAKVRNAVVGMNDMSPEMVALIEKGKHTLEQS